MSKETIMHLPLPGLQCAHMWKSCMHLWIVCALVYPVRAFVDFFAHLWIMFTIVDFSCAFVDRPVDPLHAFVDCVHECGSLTYIFRRI